MAEYKDASIDAIEDAAGSAAEDAYLAAMQMDLALLKQ